MSERQPRADEPKTRHLCADELRRQLKLLSTRDEVDTGARTLLHVPGRALVLHAQTRASIAADATVRQIDLSSTSADQTAFALHPSALFGAAKPALGGAGGAPAQGSAARDLTLTATRAAVPRELSERPRRVASRARLPLACLLALLTLGSCAYVLFRRATPKATARVGTHSPSALLRASASTADQPVPTEASEPAHPSASATASTSAALAPRDAANLLLSGDNRAALDAYRALSALPHAEPAYALIVRLLERELARCVAQGDAPCAL